MASSSALENLDVAFDLHITQSAEQAIGMADETILRLRVSIEGATQFSSDAYNRRTLWTSKPKTDVPKNHVAESAAIR
ncbi:MAG TPA: hypothetical protein VME63_09260 [Dyella sp.]|uniref:hypothetical protein n=1 Tax=Dyella sp. TaxID=1869338 RepID=UPI002C851B25|nr:hypothetical protein [Dyella sp.]HTV85584.1 hypothetical protein [Dyella sp.]